jgi:hypothetical protein
MSIKTSESKYNLINNRIKYGTNNGIIVDTNLLVTDISNNRVGINTRTPQATLDVSGSLIIDTSNIINGRTGYSINTPTDTQILTNVNNNMQWSYNQEIFDGANMFSQNTTTTFVTGIPNILGSNGKIYTTPYASPTTLILNPDTETYIQQNVTATNNTFYSGGVCTNGKIYYFSIGGFILVNDITNNRFYNIPVNYGSNAGGYAGCCLGPNGKIYAIPRYADNVLVLDPKDESYYFLTSPYIISGVVDSRYRRKWGFGVLAPNGIIYCMPAFETFFLKINTNNDTIDALTNGPILAPTSEAVSSSEKYQGGALAPNGKIYAMPFSNTGPNTGRFVLEVDPVANSYIDLSGAGTISIGSTRNYVGATCGFDGNIYSTAELGSAVLRINTSSTPVTMNTFGSINRTWGGVLAPNGKIYFNPRPSVGTSWTYIKTGIPNQQPWMLAPEFNKL